MSRPVFDAIVIGAGAAGAAAATVLARSGLRVALADRQRVTAPCFKAEKVEPDQAGLLRELGLFEGVRPVLTPIPTVATAHRGRVLQLVHIEQYGVNYWELADALRAQVPNSVELHIGWVSAVEVGPEYQQVRLADGSSLQGRLVLLAGGISPGLVQRLGIARREIRSPHSLAFGFDLVTERWPPAFASLTYYSEDVSTRVDYLTLFPIGSRCRANFFTYYGPDEARVRELSRDPSAELERLLPRLRSILGRVRVESKVEKQVIDLYTVDGPVSDGIVLVGDAHQSVCPATGTGLSKVLTDVKVVCDHIPVWLRTPGMSRAKLASYYDDPRKRRTDAKSLEWAEHRRGFSTGTSLRWRVHRARTYLGMTLRSRVLRAAGQM
jgi:2-polyprenyl-6-methoxyphenol hydroxylase-like FAD-dependent oxidoreductase